MLLFYIGFSAQHKVGHRRCRVFLAVNPNTLLGRRSKNPFGRRERCFSYSLSLRKVSAKYKVRTKPVKESSAERASILRWTGASSISCNASWSNLAFASCTFTDEETHCYSGIDTAGRERGVTARERHSRVTPVNLSSELIFSKNVPVFIQQSSITNCHFSLIPIATDLIAGLRPPPALSSLSRLQAVNRQTPKR